MRLLFSITNFLYLALALFCALQGNPFYQAVQAETIPIATPSWSMDTEKMNIAVLTIDYTTNELRQAYFMQEMSCQHPLSDQTIITHARMALNNTAIGDLMDTTLQANGLLAESLDWTGELLSWQVHLGDFTANALLHPCTGNVIFAGESIWTGQGERPYPRNPLPTQSLLHLATAITLPTTLTMIEPPLLITQTATDAWAEIADLNLVHDLTQQPFAALAFLYRPATGYVDPAEELAAAEWIFILYSEPLPLAQTQFEHYLPLIRQ